MSEKFEQIIQDIEKKVEKQYEQMADKSFNERVVLENYIMKELRNQPGANPYIIASVLTEKYGFEISGESVNRILRSKNVFMGNPEERVKLFNWSHDIAMLLKKAIYEGDVEAMNQYENTNFSDFFENANKNRQLHRVLLIELFSIIPELNESKSFKTILDNFGTAYCKDTFLSIIRRIHYVYNIPNPRSEIMDKIKHSERTTHGEKAVDEEKITDVEGLIEENERINQMLRDLQEEFSDRLSETKQQEMTEFFSALNSETYGYIIDELFILKKGFNTLRKNNYEIPEEISNIGIILSKFMQFVKDSGISPMLKPESIVKVTPLDIENYYYEGSPFSANDEVKTVKVVSPGWLWKEKDIVISRPRVKELL